MRFLEFDVDELSWDCGEDKHVGKDKHGKENKVSLRILNSQNLIVRKGVISGTNIHDEYHRTKITIVVFVWIYLLREKRIHIVKVEF